MGRAAARVVFPVENAVLGLGRALEVATSLTPAGWPKRLPLPRQQPPDPPDPP
jgi:hypothetical protein